MKIKLSLLAFLFLPSLVSAYTCGSVYLFEFRGQASNHYNNDCGQYSPLSSWPRITCEDWAGYLQNFSVEQHSNGTCDDHIRQYSYVTTPTAGYVCETTGICHPPCSLGSIYSDSLASCVVPPVPPLSAYNNNPDGCKTAGGVYFSDKVCRSTADAYSHLSSSSEFKRGAFIAINGFVWTAAGIVTGFPPGIGFGVHAMLLGAGMMAFSPDGKLNSSSDTAIAPSSDSTTADGRIKVTLLPDSQALTKSDPSTGKVDQVAIIPNAVIDDIIQKQRYLMGGDLYQPNVTAPSPSLKDVKEISYDYVNNTATTLTHSPTSTPENPVTTSQITPISVIQNPDGTVTTLPTNTTIAPTVSGSGGGSLVLTSTSGTGGTGSGTGTTSGTGLDYSGVLHDIRTNTSFMRDSLNPTLNQNHGPTGIINFDGYSDILNGSFKGFVFTDPLGINNLGVGGIQSYGFDLYGRHFVILDQAMIDQLPLEMMRTLFLFIAAILGLTTVVSGV